MAGREGIRILKLTCGVIGGFGIFSGVALLVENARHPKINEKLIPTAFAATWFKSGENNDSIKASKVAWDYNWDRREPKALVRQVADDKLSNEERSEILKKHKPTVTRHILLIRHGHYVIDGAEDINRELTEKGKDQAALTGQRLAELEYPFTVIYNSTMTRARQTANIIAKHIPDVPRDECGMLREGAPIQPEPPVGHWKPEMKQFFEDGARIEAAFRKYFHRADCDQETDSYEVIVCHANVIRYFVCRALQFPPEAWLRMSLHHGSITWLSIRPSGRVSLRTLGDSGHMPPDKLSVS